MDRNEVYDAIPVRNLTPVIYMTAARTPDTRVSRFVNEKWTTLA